MPVGVQCFYINSWLNSVFICLTFRALTLKTAVAANKGLSCYSKWNCHGQPAHFLLTPPKVIFLKKVLYHGHDFTACLTAQVMRKCLRPVYLDGPDDVKRAIRWEKGDKRLQLISFAFSTSPHGLTYCCSAHLQMSCSHQMAQTRLQPPNDRITINATGK